MPKMKRKGAGKLAVRNAAKTLLANIRFASVDKPIRTLTVTSSTPNEGKSTVALNLAKAIATSGATVLLVECDMRRRSQAEMIGVHSLGGVYSVLSGQMTVDEAVVEVSQIYISWIRNLTFQIQLTSLPPIAFQNSFRL